ncbi:hypothetical protein JNW88_23245 [Micromonospora sp. ATA32]|nr:hypothetical protein [Micromonospora sp. ATA32]
MRLVHRSRLPAGQQLTDVTVEGGLHRVGERDRRPDRVRLDRHQLVRDLPV